MSTLRHRRLQFFRTSSPSGLLVADPAPAPSLPLAFRGGSGGELALWGSSKFDATTHRDEHGLYEREIISYRGRLQVRWSVRDARSAWEALSEGEGAAFLDGATTEMSARVNRHMTVGNDKDIVALEGEIVRALHI